MPNALLQDRFLQNVPTIRGYKVLYPCVLFEKLGEGGMGSVYRGRHIKLNADAAVKCLKSTDAADSPAVIRFKREASLVANLRHPNLIGVYDIEEQHGLHYIVMEYVDGESVEDRVRRRGVMSAAEALTIALGVAQGLIVAHETGVVHRDIKPPNILISRKGEVKLLDLGIAKTEDPQYSAISESRDLIGTPQYMAPEQFEGAGSAVPQSDVYAIGATLYFMLTGDDAFTGANPVVIMKKVIGGFPSEDSWPASLHPVCAALILSATQKDPAKRPRSAGDFADELRTALAAAGGPADLSDAAAGSLKTKSSSTPAPDKAVLTEIKLTLSKLSRPGSADIARTIAEHEQTIMERGPGYAPRPIPAAAASRFRTGGGRMYAAIALASVVLIAGGAAAYVARKPGSALINVTQDPLALAEEEASRGEWAAALRRLRATDPAAAPSYVETANRILRKFRKDVPVADQALTAGMVDAARDIEKKGSRVASLLLLTHRAAGTPVGGEWPEWTARLTDALSSTDLGDADGAIKVADAVLKQLHDDRNEEARTAAVSGLDKSLAGWRDRGISHAGLLLAERLLNAGATSVAAWDTLLGAIAGCIADSGLEFEQESRPLAEKALNDLFIASRTDRSLVSAGNIETMDRALTTREAKTVAQGVAPLLVAERLARSAGKDPTAWRDVVTALGRAARETTRPEYSDAAHAALCAYFTALKEKRGQFNADLENDWDAVARRDVGMASLVLAEHGMSQNSVPRTILALLGQALRDGRIAQDAAHSKEVVGVADAMLGTLAPRMADGAAWSAVFPEESRPVLNALAAPSLGSRWAPWVLVETSTQYDPQKDVIEPVHASIDDLLSWSSRIITTNQSDLKSLTLVARAFLYQGDALSQHGPIRGPEAVRRHELAVRSFDRGGELGNPDCRARAAQIALYYHLTKGKLDPSDWKPSKATLDGLDDAARQGNARALYVTALYAYHKLLEKDERTFSNLLEEASKKGYGPAIDMWNDNFRKK